MREPVVVGVGKEDVNEAAEKARLLCAASGNEVLLRRRAKGVSLCHRCWAGEGCSASNTSTRPTLLGSFWSHSLSCSE